MSSRRSNRVKPFNPGVQPVTPESRPVELNRMEWGTSTEPSQRWGVAPPPGRVTAITHAVGGAIDTKPNMGGAPGSLNESQRRVRRQFAKTRINIEKRNKPHSASSQKMPPWRMRHQKRWKRFKESYISLTSTLDIWKSTYKEIEGTFGAGVVSWFTLLNVLFFLNFYIFLLILLFIVLPPVIFNGGGRYDISVTGEDENGTRSVEEFANNCSSLYVVNVDGSNSLQLFLDFLQGTGWMEKQVIFYGYFDARNYAMGSSLYYNLPLAYFLVTLSVLLLSLVLMVRRTGRSTRSEMLSRRFGSGKMYKYNHLILCGWDYTLNTEESASLKHAGMYHEIKAEIREDEERKRRSTRSRLQKCRIYSLRFVVNVIVIGVLGGAAYLIVYVTQEALKFKESASYPSQPPVVKFLMEYLTSIMFTLLNATIPFLFAKLVLLEDFRKDMQIKLTLIRTVVLRLASVVVIIWTLYLQVTCEGSRDHCNVSNSGTCPVFRCWETYVGQQIYKLVLMQFIVDVLFVIFVDFPRKLIVSYCPCKLSRMIGLPEFNLPKNVLDLVYAQALCWLGAFVSPLIPGITVLKLFIVFFLKKITLRYNYTPSAEPYKTSRSNMFFVVILLIAFIGCCIPVFYMLWGLEPSHGCGAFRIYLRSYDIWDITVNRFPSVLSDIVKFFFSAPFFICVAVALAMVVYYMRQLLTAYMDMTKNLRKQLKLETKDSKTYRMQLIKVTGRRPTSARRAGEG